jgi:protein-S-isoprenylcysteine O-methyltransferase Ste14
MIVVSWLLYFLLHSLLASLVVKSFIVQHMPSLMPAYRLAYNLVALLLIVIPLWLTFAKSSDYLWQWQGLSGWIANMLALLAIAGFFWSLKYYDGQEFLGFKQLKTDARTIEDQESFKLSPLHRFVRHPWYFLGLVLIWSREMTPYMLTSAMMMTVYFWIGSRLEEKKLLKYYGERYRLYSDKVAGLLPLPWKYLSAEEAGRLEKSLPVSKLDQ